MTAKLDIIGHQKYFQIRQGLIFRESMGTLRDSDMIT